MTAYESFEHLQQELRDAVKPYRNLLKYDLRKADYNGYWSEQSVTSAWEYAKAYQCEHVTRRPVRWTLGNGVERVTLQCVACGDKYSSGVRKADYPNFDELSDLDEGLIADARGAFNAFKEELSEAYKEAWGKFEYQKNELGELERLAQDAAWWARYNEYLKSETWRDKRERVLERDNYLCQACLRRDANQAHHLTYKHVFDEPLFELISVCTPCHEKLHPHMKEAEHAHVN